MPCGTDWDRVGVYGVVDALSGFLLEHVDQTAGVGNGVARSSHDLSRRDLMSVDLRTGVVVRTQRCAFERHPREQTA
jgi:hypothetical protein